MKRDDDGNRAGQQQNKPPQTYYDILELNQKPPSEVTQLDIKKAYRRLALRYHPDRNNGSAESTERFQQIGHAYETLSDAGRKARYDECIATGYEFDHDGHAAGSGGEGWAEDDNRQYQYQDPFSVFNDLFHNDPFFATAFKDMDDEFSRRFQEGQTTTHSAAAGAGTAGGSSPSGRTSTVNGAGGGPLNKLSMAICGTDIPGDIQSKGGFGPWLLDRMGVQLTVTTYKSDIDGTVSASSYTNADVPGAYTDKRTKTYVRDGKRVTVRSMERGGNKIEDTYVEGELAERRVNGVLERSIGNGSK